MAGDASARLLHEKIDVSTLPEDLQARVHAHGGRSWSTSYDGIRELRDWLLKEQRYRCAYCQLSIPSVSVGLCELDHILPKGVSAPCDTVKARTNEFASRQHTLGYPTFAYTVRNLAVTCKQCNASKKSFDPLADRTTLPTALPIFEADYAWVHPHFVEYSLCISINENWLYSWLNSKGEYTIKACKLDQSEVLARRLASEALASQSHSLDQFLYLLVGRIDEIGHLAIARTLCRRFDLDEGLASQILDLWKDARRAISGMESLARQAAALIGAERLRRKPNMDQAVNLSHGK